MRWIESDTVQLSQDYHTAHDEARIAMRERFPNAWKWFEGYNRPGVLSGEQMRGILEEGKKPDEVEEWEADYDQVREMVSFLINNWTEAGRVTYFHYDDWKTIYDALRYCAEKIGYLNQNKAVDALRDNGRLLSARLIAEGYCQTGNVEESNWGNPTFYFYNEDWATILYACKYAWKHMPDDNPEFVEFRERLERMTPAILDRVKHYETQKLTSYGYDDIKIHKALHEVVTEPWNRQEVRDRARERYRELRKLQGDEEESVKDWLHVLRIRLKPGATIKIVDWQGKEKGIDVVPEDELHHSYRGWDCDVPFGGGIVVLGHRGKNDKGVVSVDEVEFEETEISCQPNQQEGWVEYVYANYPVKKYQHKD